MEWWQYILFGIGCGYVLCSFVKKLTTIRKLRNEIRELRKITLSGPELTQSERQALEAAWRLNRGGLQPPMIVEVPGEINAERLASFREYWERSLSSQRPLTPLLSPTGVTLSIPNATAPNQSPSIPSAPPNLPPNHLTFQEFVESMGIKWGDVSQGQYPCDQLREEYWRIYAEKKEPKPKESERVFRFDESDRVLRFDDEKDSEK